MRIISWNVRRASATSPAWKYLLDCAPDLALLQEVGTVPDSVQRGIRFSRSVRDGTERDGAEIQDRDSRAGKAGTTD
jgi:exonuclease III